MDEPKEVLRHAQPRNQASSATGSVSWLWFYVTIAGSLLLRVSLFDFESGDARAFYAPWYDLFVTHGRWNAFKSMEPHSVYPPLYMYLLSLSTLLPLPKLYAIKLISLVSDYIAAWFFWRIVRHEFPTALRAWAALTVFLFLPTVVMNSALWGQCDVMYTGCFLASFFYLLANRPLACLMAFGFACSLKPQAIFWCPLLAGLFFKGRLPWKWIWIPAAVYVVCGLPVVMAGWPFTGMIGQMGSYGGHTLPDLTFGAANWYQWVFEQHRDIFWSPGVVLTLIGTAFLVLWMQDRPAKHLTDGQWVISFALLSVLFPPFFLPGMHERYFFAADVLSVIYAFYVPGGWRATMLIQFASAFAYLFYLFEKQPAPLVLLPLAILAAMFLVARELIDLDGVPTKADEQGKQPDHEQAA